MIPVNCSFQPKTTILFFEIVLRYNFNGCLIISEFIIDMWTEAWDNLVVYLNGVQEVGGSSPPAPTIL